MDVTYDLNSKRIYITYEGSARIVWVNTRTLEQEGYIDLADFNPSVGDLAGVVSNEIKNRTYVVEREENRLYILSWDEDKEELILMDPQVPNKPYSNGNSYVVLSGLEPERAYGIALDVERLYVTNNTSTVHYYDTDSWEHLGTRDVGRRAMAIAVDPNNGAHPAYLYAGGFQPPDGSGSHTYLIKHNLEDPNTSNHTENDIGTITACRRKLPRAAARATSVWERSYKSPCRPNAGYGIIKSGWRP